MNSYAKRMTDDAVLHGDSRPAAVELEEGEDEFGRSRRDTKIADRNAGNFDARVEMTRLI